MFGSFSRNRSGKVALDNKHLRKLVMHHMDRHGPRCDLNHIDVSQVQDFTGIFANTSFDGDISKWNVANATSMQELFAFSPFQGDISQWNVSRAMDMSRMFFKSPFQGDISAWNVSKVTSMHSMFAQSLFNGDISKWDTSSVVTMSAMFMSSAFSQSLADWNVSRVCDMSMMFHNSLFRGDVSRWDLASLKHATHIFDSAYFESDLPQLELSSLLTGSSMVSAAFRGKVSEKIDDYTSVRKMFPNAVSTYNYLGYLYKVAGAGAIHIDYALQHTDCPTWFDVDLFAWVKHEQHLCAEMGMNAQAVRDLVKNNFLLGASKGERADSIPFEFEAVRSVA